jgi:predicted HD phosphohydrolase
MTKALVSVVRNMDENQQANLEKIFRETNADEKVVVDCGKGFKSDYNAYYGPSIKIASNQIESDVLVYVSSTRARMYDPTWIEDIVKPLSDPRCGMSGCLQSCEYNRIARHATDIFEPQIHVQGGVFAIRNEVMRTVDYGKFPQVFSDVYISWKLVRMGYFLSDVRSIRSSAGSLSPFGKMRVGYPDRDAREKMFNDFSRQASDINEHLATLREYAGRASRIVELGTRGGVSTLALLAGQPDQLVTIDIDPNLVDIAHLEGHYGETKFASVIADSLQYDIDQCDLLFIDTDHNYQQLFAELSRHHTKVTRWIIMHDTETFAGCGEAYRDFLEQHKSEWKELVHFRHNNGLTILERVGK